MPNAVAVFNITAVNARVLLIVSLVLNVALGALALSWFRSSRNPGADGVSNIVVIATNPSIRVAKTNIILQPRELTWRDIESTNYASYVSNLRGFGVPEWTIRDIIVADVNQLYARKRHQLNVTTNDMQWWRSEPDPAELRAALDRAQALEDERRALLAGLLGPNWDASMEQEPTPVPLTGPVLASLTPEQKQAVQDIVAYSQQMVRDYVNERSAEGETLSEAELARLREHTRQELAEKLTPQQLNEFLLRYSYNANQLREELRGLNATPEEFRRVFAAIDPIDRELQFLSEDGDPATAARRAELEQQRLAAIQEALDPERYAAYRAGRDPAYGEALAEATEAGAPVGAGQALYEINQAAALERERVAKATALTPEQKAQELAYIERQQEVARAAVLGLEPPAGTKTTPPLPPLFKHSVMPGETMAAISLRYRVPMSELLKANPGVGQGPGGLQPGQSVRIPEAPSAPTLVPTRVPPFGNAGERR